MTTKALNKQYPALRPPAPALESSLGTAATKDVGTIAGTVAAGDDSRFGGLTQAQVLRLGMGA